ncbi:MAG: DRTGG domain-containing protein [Eubacteriaceae bacterium]
MKIKDLIQTRKFTLLNEVTSLDKEIESIYICDLLSWVMSHAGNKCAWITVQTHANIVAVALLLEMACIIIPEGIKLEETTIVKAIEEDIPIISTKLNSYEIASMFSKEY